MERLWPKLHRHQVRVRALCGEDQGDSCRPRLESSARPCGYLRVSGYARSLDRLLLDLQSGIAPDAETVTLVLALLESMRQEKSAAPLVQLLKLQWQQIHNSKLAINCSVPKFNKNSEYEFEKMSFRKSVMSRSFSSCLML